jgi:hypothetical protein
MLKSPHCVSALLVALLAGPAQALPLVPGPIAATGVESVRFEARGGPKHRGARHRRSGDCRRCGRGLAILASKGRDHAHSITRPSPPPRLTFTMRTDTLGPLRVRLYSSTWVDACEQKHPTFVARTGTFEGDDGKRLRCE